MDTSFAAQTLHCYPPAPSLRGLVSHYWLSRDGGGDRHRVLPDGCVDLVLRLRDGDGAWQAFGTSTRPLDVPVDAGCIYFGIRCLLYTSPSPRDKRQSRMPSSA